MKAQSIILLAGFVLMSLFSYSQTKNNNTPKKGYYSISTNAEKLNVQTPTSSNYVKAEEVQAGAVTRPKTAKGYYAIGNNNQPSNGVTLVKTTDTVILNAVRPVVTKGYYSIGRNAQKLQ